MYPTCQRCRSRKIDKLPAGRPKVWGWGGGRCVPLRGQWSIYDWTHRQSGTSTHMAATDSLFSSNLYMLFPGRPDAGTRPKYAWIRIAKVQRSKGCICSLRNLQQWEDQSISMKKHDDKPKSRLLLVIAQTVSAFTNWRAEGDGLQMIYEWMQATDALLAVIWGVRRMRHPALLILQAQSANVLSLASLSQT